MPPYRKRHTPLLSLGLSPEQPIRTLFVAASTRCWGPCICNGGHPLLCLDHETRLLSSRKIYISRAPVWYLHSMSPRLLLSRRRVRKRCTPRRATTACTSQRRSPMSSAATTRTSPTRPPSASRPSSRGGCRAEQRR